SVFICRFPIEIVFWHLIAHIFSLTVQIIFLLSIGHSYFMVIRVMHIAKEDIPMAINVFRH
ncbi:TPA: hypothetical protein ACX37U_001252, partial [Serratia marcescens]